MSHNVRKTPYMFSTLTSIC